MQEVDPTLKAAYLSAQRRQNPQLLHAAAGVSALGFIAFFATDFMIAGAPIRALAGVRLVAVLSLLGLVALSRSLGDRRCVASLGLALLWCTCSGIIAVTALVGGGQSQYHSAVALAFISHAAFLPATLLWSSASYLALILFYNLVMISSGSLGGVVAFVSSNIVLIMAGVAASALLAVGNRIRLAAFVLDSQLKQAHENLKALDGAKNNFFANISHELRTPLTLIIASVEGMSESEETVCPKKQQQVDICRRNGIRLLRLVDDLLELTRLESENFRLRLDPFDLTKLVSDLCTQARPLAQRKNIAVHCDVALDASIMITADQNQIDRVLLNLIANAIKFTPAGGTLRVRAQLQDQGARIEVEDTGRGIPPDALAFIFDRFYQVKQADDGQRRSGVGIGLSLCQKLVQLHQGLLEAKSVLGQGTTMSVWLPLAPQIDEKLVERRDRSGDARRERRAVAGLAEWDYNLRSQDTYRLAQLEEVTDRRVVSRPGKGTAFGSVLVVDDNVDIVELLVGMLSGDYEVFVALDGVEGFDAAQRHRPDLIVSDVTMPRSGGFEFLAKVRADKELRETPFILLTAQSESGDRILASESGADAFLAKPFHPQELRTEVRRLMRKQVAQAAALLDNRSLALRVMAEGIAHDVLNPLGFVRGALHILSTLVTEALSFADQAQARVLQIGGEAKEFYKSGEEGLARVRDSIEQLRRFSRSAQDQPATPASVNDAVQRVLTVAGAKARVKTELRATGLVNLRQGELEQVLLNLIINAQQAGGEACEIRVETWEVAGSPGVSVAVRDDGPGMDKQAVQKIFDPYYTTKEMGTGLGLTVSREIVRKHGGTMTVESKKGEGTAFTIWLPLSPAALPAA